MTDVWRILDRYVESVSDEAERREASAALRLLALDEGLDGILRRATAATRDRLSLHVAAPCRLVLSLN